MIIYNMLCVYNKFKFRNMLENMQKQSWQTHIQPKLSLP